MLAILTTHPIQYQVPLWQQLARDGRVSFEVWFLLEHALRPSYDREFGKSFAWDIKSLEGFPHRFINVPDRATPNSFWECRLNEDLRQRMKEGGVKNLWIQGWQVAAYWQAVLAAKSIGVAVWLRGESNDLSPTPWWKRPAKRLLLGQLFRRVDYFLYIGTANRRFYEKFGVSSAKLRPAPYAVDNDRFASQAEALQRQRTELRGQWGIDEDAFCVMFCGKFISKKRPMDVVAAVQLLMRSGSTKKMHILFVGSGVLGSDLRNACNVVYDIEYYMHSDNRKAIWRDGEVARGRNSAVTQHRETLMSHLPCATFSGFLNQTEISKAYVAADCLVLPSNSGETWGLVVNEAMASGLPCIVSDQCGSAADLGATPNQVFPCGDVMEMAVCLSKVVSLAVGVNDRPMPRSFADTISTVVSLVTLSEG